MKILIIGNLGYVGSVLSNNLKNLYPQSYIIGFDIGYFFENSNSKKGIKKYKIDKQLFGDVRNFDKNILCDVKHVIYLAAISNDPMGKEFIKVTKSVNCDAAIKIAQIAREQGCKSFVFASSCSIYGFADNQMKTESSEINPLTAYAESKVEAEKELFYIANDNFLITCLRFATACGFSPEMRLDLVLNDFVANALCTGNIQILSDGSPWRPLIHVNDMARSFNWAINRTKNNGGCFLSVNTGSNFWNYQIKDLAENIKSHIPRTKIKINKNAMPDKRSYKVDFSLFANLASNHVPVYDLKETIKDLIKGFKVINFNDHHFRNSNFIRLNILKNHIENGNLNDNLMWTNSAPQNKRLYENN